MESAVPSGGGRMDRRPQARAVVEGVGITGMLCTAAKGKTLFASKRLYGCGAYHVGSPWLRAPDATEICNIRVVSVV